MKKKAWLIVLIAVLCVLVLAVTVWCVASGVRSVLPEPEQPLPELEGPPPDAQEEVIVPIDPVTGAPAVEDNTVVDPWGDLETEDPIGSTPIEETPTETVPDTQDGAAEEEIDMEEWSTSDEGWTAIY